MKHTRTNLVVPSKNWGGSEVESSGGGRTSFTILHRERERESKTYLSIMIHKRMCVQACTVCCSHFLELYFLSNQAEKRITWDLPSFNFSRKYFSSCISKCLKLKLRRRYGCVWESNLCYHFFAEWWEGCVAVAAAVAHFQFQTGHDSFLDFSNV